MALEIERKFLVDTNKWTPSQSGTHYAQAYLTDQAERTVRVRIAGDKAFLTIKGPSDGISRREYEYTIPVSDAQEMMHLAVNPPVEKIRHKEIHHGLLWEIDIFKGKNAGLVLAEVELESKDQPVNVPDWAIKEVSGDVRYFNSYLAENPFSEWEKE